MATLYNALRRHLHNVDSSGQTFERKNDEWLFAYNTMRGERLTITRTIHKNMLMPEWVYSARVDGDECIEQHSLMVKGQPVLYSQDLKRRMDTRSGRELDQVVSIADLLMSMGAPSWGEIQHASVDEVAHRFSVALRTHRKREGFCKVA